MAFLFDPHFQAVDANGLPLAGGLLYFYVAGTSTGITTYQDADATTPHASPVVADSSGAFPAIFLSTVNPYKYILKTSAGITVQTVDDVPVNTADVATITAAAAAGALPYVTQAQEAAAEAEAAAAAVAGLNATSVQGRLSLTSGVASPSSDVAGQTQIFYVPSSGQYAPIYDGTSFVARSIGTQLTLTLDADTGHTGFHSSGSNYDLFVINDGGTIRLVTGPAWNDGASPGSDVARGTGAGSSELEVFNGVLVNKNSITARFGSAAGNTVSVPARRATYVGTFRATAHGQATDSMAKRLLFNAYNQVLRPIGVTDASNTWAYSTATWRQARATTANRVEVLLGLAGVAVDAAVSVMVGSTGAASAGAAIGLDSTTTISADCRTWFGFFGASPTGNQTVSGLAIYHGFPGLGWHTLVWLEQGGGTETQTFYGTNADASSWRTGMSGQLLG
jgi:hypothetical protein